LKESAFVYPGAAGGTLSICSNVAQLHCGINGVFCVMCRPTKPTTPWTQVAGSLPNGGV
jgi:hypothetical protein